jgi:hypothetical protein
MSRRLGRGASFAVALAGLLLAGQPQAAAESIKVQVSNFPSADKWPELKGISGIRQSPPGFFGLTYAEKMQIVSRPYVRIENASSREIVGVQMDMENWSAKIESFELISAPVDGFQTQFSWSDAKQSAFFSFDANPLTRGQAVIMRMSTGAKTTPGAPVYSENQTLFSPATLDCVTNTGGVCFDVFTNKPGTSFAYDATQLQFTGSEIATTDCLCTENNAVNIATLEDPAGVEMTCVVPVPEPGAVVMAASAAAVLALSCLHRRRRVWALAAPTAAA